ncbi:hypothetical protein JYB62_01760 [Algoriphagus lutimaris]|uniref:hypothetical protein n=1 Tax=Algoriphagus lutimaris TaxID=613197 RepID=UPI00196A4CBF|nr:hypothetical protein [Algoriphagus lutimaris]MBN3518713.1 hypothetical protein [Algoriphagus lutimaris]
MEFEPLENSQDDSIFVKNHRVEAGELFLSSSVLGDLLKNNSTKYITLEDFNYDWTKAIQHTQESEVSIIKLQKGKKYRVKEYKTQDLIKNLFIVSEGNSEICFGIDNYDQWNPNPSIDQDRYVFNLGKWNARVGVLNVDLKSATTISEVQPFYRGIFKNSPFENQSGLIALINSNTDMEFGLLYSGGQEEDLILIQKNVNFEGIIWQELKANNGGGLKVIMENCNLKQVDPPTYYKKQLKFSKNSVMVNDGSFNQIENSFQGMGNSSNIVFVEGMTFLLPPSTFIRNYHNRYNGDNIESTNRDISHYIHPIPTVGEKFLMSRSYDVYGVSIPEMLRNVINWEKLGLDPIPNVVRSLQVGDRLRIDGQEYLIKITDRIPGVAFNSEYRFNGQDSYYAQEFKLDKDLPEDMPMVVEVEVLESKGEQLLDGNLHEGYIIFKYNKNWQTNMDVNHGLDYMLASNPFGVLSYNHKEISLWAKNTVHQGYYRQSKSGKGNSKGYTLINCSGFGDQFNPEVPVKESGEMAKKAKGFIDFLMALV